ncbi:hypothetical protein [Galactobacter caseinivorans]|uniref:hypothetical protein n=1 Tax=Galactobacter caseinivorans TaxID=2676123 RepID=UPI0011C38D3F|nr:hypothetical protein [Galactobacter caseinivorans]
MDLIMAMVGLLLIAMAFVVILIPRITTAGWAHGNMLRLFVMIGWAMALIAAVLLEWKTEWGFWAIIGVAVLVWAVAVGSRMMTVRQKAAEHDATRGKRR